MYRLIFLFIIVYGLGLPGLKAQDKIPLYPLTKSIKNVFTQYQPIITPFTPSFFCLVDTPPLPGVKPPLGPRDFYRQHFGFFCKQEWGWEKKTQLPVKVRLGSYQEAQRIEGKR